MTRAVTPLLLLVAAVVITGCVNVRHGPGFDPHLAPAPTFQETSATNAIDPAWLKPSTNEFRLGPGDRVDIDLLGSAQGTPPAVRPAAGDGGAGWKNLF